MKNEYRIRGQVVWIRLKRREHPDEWARISLNRLPAVLKFPGTWCAMVEDRGNVVYKYAFGKDYTQNRRKGGGGGRTVYLHRLILRLLPGRRDIEGNHINWKTLDCTDENLEKIGHSGNQGHRRQMAHPATNNTSGYRNVYPTKSGKWKVEITKVYYGTFDNLDDALATAKRVRKELNRKRLADARGRGRKRRKERKPQQR